MNKSKGWGLKTELIFLCIFVICLITAIFGLYRMGLLGNLNEALDPNPNDDVRVELRSSNKTNNSKKKVISNEFSYMDLENQMIEGAKTYILNTYNNELGLDTIIVKVSQLKELGLLNELKDEFDFSCSGYVDVFKEGEVIIYDPYLKCSQYITAGYIERRDD